VELLDGDVVRAALSPGLGFSRADRDSHIRRLGFLCELLSRNGVIVLVAAISPYRETREEVRRKIPNFVEVFVECPIDVLASRDVKGLYKRALAGEVANFTGVSDPYEAPVNPDVAVHSDRESVEESLAKIWGELERRGLITTPGSSISDGKSE
jgi:adenylyl-sulfate kinase